MAGPAAENRRDNMKYKKKFWGFFLGTALTASSLTACGSGNEGTVSAEARSEAEQSETESSVSVREAFRQTAAKSFLFFPWNIRMKLQIRLFIIPQISVRRQW